MRELIARKLVFVIFKSPYELGWVYSRHCTTKTLLGQSVSCLENGALTLFVGRQMVLENLTFRLIDHSEAQYPRRNFQSVG